MIQVDHKSGKSREIMSYPAIGVASNGLTVLFWDRGKGIVLIGDQVYDVGAYNTLWGMHFFYLMDGEVTLRNAQ